MTRPRYDAIGYYGIVLTLVIAGVFAPADKRSLAGVCTVFGLVMAPLPILYLIIRARHRVRTFTGDDQARKFVEQQIGRVADEGGEVFSTYMLEDPQGDDLVSPLLSNSTRRVEYRRLILIDDPDTEQKWLGEFLALRRHPQLSVAAHVVSNSGRLVSRYIRKVIPFLNVFIVRHVSPLQRSVLMISLPARNPKEGGGPHKFAIAIYDDRIVEIARNYFDNLLASAGTLIREVRSLDQYDAWRIRPPVSQTTMSLIETVREIAENSDNIVHVGVFGSTARRLIGTYVDRLSADHENDIDLIVVCREGAERSDVKQQLQSAITKRHATAHIEWSNESPEFYWMRTNYQVDIQLHTEQDSYYVLHPLLGWSVFLSYYVLYSEGGKPTAEFIGVPLELLDIQQRVRACVEDEKFGLERFLAECMRNDPRVDLRRVVSICMRNIAWAMTGTRPYTLDQAFQFVAPHFAASMRNQLRELSHYSAEAAAAAFHKHAPIVVEFIRAAIRILKST